MTVNISGDTGVSQVQAGAIEVTDIPNSTITNDKLVDNTITVDKLHTSVQSSLGTRNLLINGDMRIAQRATSVSGIATGYRTVDRFQTLGTNPGVWTHSQDTDVPSGQGFARSLKLECTTANSSPVTLDAFLLRQRIEGQNLQHLKKGTSNAESLTLSFWVKSNKTGTYIAELYDRDNTRQLSKAYTINTADTWEKKTITYEGDTTGVLNNHSGVSLDVHFWLMVGSDWTSGTLDTTWGGHLSANRVVGQTVNLADSTSNYINITGVQLEVGTEATEFEHRPFDMELHRCQRYFCKSYNYSDAVGTNTWVGTVTERNYDSSARTEVPLDVNFPVRMRATPGLTAYSKTGISGYRTSGSTSIDNGTSETTAITLYGSETNIRGTAMAVALSSAIWMQFHYTADAEL